MIFNTRAAISAALVISATLLIVCASSGPGVSDDKLQPVTLVSESGKHVIHTEIADTPFKQSRGLMFRRSMPDNRGMLFLYDAPQEITMWMKNTFIPLDMVFIRSDGRIHRIETDTEPFSEKTISSGGDVVAVLELNAGISERLKLKPGDKVLYKFFNGK